GHCSFPPHVDSLYPAVCPLLGMMDLVLETRLHGGVSVVLCDFSFRKPNSALLKKDSQYQGYSALPTPWRYDMTGECENNDKTNYLVLLIYYNLLTMKKHLLLLSLFFVTFALQAQAIQFTTQD